MASAGAGAMMKRIFTILSVAFLVGYYLIEPVLTYNQSTSENVSMAVVAEPFIDSDKLVYRWSGDLVKSCEVSIRRRFVDSAGVVTSLISHNFDPLPVGSLGAISYEVAISVPFNMSEGVATYQATEIPKCSWLQRMFPKSFDYPEVKFTVTR